jgi:hypothetical protein
MLRGLKVTMVVFGAVVCIEGILDIALPVQRAAGMGLDQCAAHAQLPMVVLGATWLVGGAWTIAAARDPLRHLNWVKFALTFPLVLLLALTGAALRGDVAFRQVVIDIAFDAFFVVLFIVFFPRRQRASTSRVTGPG